MAYEAGVMIGSVGVLWFLAILMINTDEEHIAMKLFYLLTSVWLMSAIMSLAVSIAEDNSASTAVVGTLSVMYSTSIWIAVLVSAYFLIYYIYVVFKSLNRFIKMKQRGNNGF